MYTIVKILSADDGEPREKNLQVWHLSITIGDSPRTLCHGEAYGYGESGCQFKERNVSKLGVTCGGCKRIIREIQRVVI